MKADDRKIDRFTMDDPGNLGFSEKGVRYDIRERTSLSNLNLKKG